MKMQFDWREVRREIHDLIDSDDSSISFFPWGGDDFSFNDGNCTDYVMKKMKQAYEIGVREGVVKVFQAKNMADAMGGLEGLLKFIEENGLDKPPTTATEICIKNENN